MTAYVDEPAPIWLHDERRRRVGRRHRLAPADRGRGAAEVARSLVALHSTDPATVYLSVAARSVGSIGDVDAALYDGDELVRLLAMRRTVWVVPVELVPIVTAACARSVATVERRKLVRLVEEAGISPNGARWLTAVEADVLTVLEDRGEAFGGEVREAVPALEATYSGASGKAYDRTVAVSSRVLFQLAAEGRIVRGRPRGTWLSSQYQWRLAPECEALDEGVAQAELARRWLTTFGPASPRDLQWWAGWTVAATKRALAAIGAVEVDGGYVLAGDDDPEPEVEPWAALLPGLDPTPMGWKERDWYLGGYAPLLFDSTGNVGPTVWWNGRIVGGWGQRPDGEVVTRLLDDIGRDGGAAVAAQAERLSSWLGGVRVTPRFRCPLERELST